MKIGVGRGGGNCRFRSTLWTATAELARSHGVCQTAQVLRVEYKKLKQLTDGQAGSKPVQRRRAPAPATFMELAPPPTAAAECAQHPPEWMPWNYRDTLARLATPEAA